MKMYLELLNVSKVIWKLNKFISDSLEYDKKWQSESMDWGSLDLRIEL